MLKHVELNEGALQMQTQTFCQSVLVTERHTLDTIKSIINSKKPMILILKTDNPSLNNHIINYSQQLITHHKWEWLKENTEINTKHVYDKRKNKKMTTNTISLTLKSPSELQNSCSAFNSQKTENKE